MPATFQDKKVSDLLVTPSSHAGPCGTSTAESTWECMRRGGAIGWKKEVIVACLPGNFRAPLTAAAAMDCGLIIGSCRDGFWCTGVSLNDRSIDSAFKVCSKIEGGGPFGSAVAVGNMQCKAGGRHPFRFASKRAFSLATASEFDQRVVESSTVSCPGLTSRGRVQPGCRSKVVKTGTTWACVD